MSAEPGFVHLHVHSSYSLLEGALTIARLADLAKADRQPALALTDTDNLFGALEFSEKMAGAGVQPIIGVALAVDFADHEFRAARTGPLRCGRGSSCWPRSEDGYRNLMRLSSRAFLETPSGEPPHLKLAWLDGATDGLIALTGGPGGPLDLAVAAGQSIWRPRAASISCACSATGSMSSSSATTSGGTGDRGPPHRHRLCQGNCAGRDQ